MISKYTGKLAGAIVFAGIHAFSMIQSLRIDSGLLPGAFGFRP
ncbi:hypothetical protein ACFY78_11360 [Streptomyces olindensis]